MNGSETIKEEAKLLGERIFSDKPERIPAFVERLTNICEQVEDKDILIIHNPGGWGSSHLEDLLQWERSIVEGVSCTMDSLGYKQTLMQYFRSKTGWRAVLGDIREQGRFFRNKARLMAEELNFIAEHFKNLQILIVGVSQGAAFSNAVIQNLNGLSRVSSVELGTPFYYKSKRVISDRTLVLDSNGLMPDALMEWDVPTIVKTYLGAPFRWLKYRLQGKKVRFTLCINVPGHDYNWEYPEVQTKVEEFLKVKYGNNREKEVDAR